MDVWVRYWAKRIAIAGACLVMILCIALQMSPPVAVVRGLVVGLVIYVSALLLGGVVGQMLVRILAEDALKREAEDQQEEDPGDRAIERIRDRVLGRDPGADQSDAFPEPAQTRSDSSKEAA